MTDVCCRSFCSIGDTHGQFYDFMNLLSLTGKPGPTHTLLFNGDFVDRGSWSTEILLVLFAYKCISSFSFLSLFLRLTDENLLQGCIRTEFS
jgi:hypothetical protein